MRRKYIIGLVGLLILGGYYWYQSAENNTSAVRYVTVKAEKGTITTSISGSGNIVVDQLATVDPTISGTVAGLAVNVGDLVKKGQLLFTIINDDLSVSKGQSYMSLQNARIAVSQAKANLSNAKNSSGDTERDREILRSKIAAAEGSLAVAELSYKNALSDAAKRQVTSPISGTVNAINIKNGDDLSRLSSSSDSQAPIIIGDLDTLKAQVQVNEVDIYNVSIGQKAMMTYSAIDGLAVSGKVEKIDALGTIAQGVVNYNVTIGLDTLDGRLRSGMSVSAKIITDVKQDVITVPNSALKVQGNKTYVEVLNSGTGLPEQRDIEIGVANNTDTEIMSGISVGDSVVTQTIDASVKTIAPVQTGGGLRVPGLGGGGGRGG
ncbi:MAG: efflux RND transporter periplasmic adaptor subunit [bacterium]|nr:efflux RND transporter periplasmic adaptor subunit [bacterium]